MPIPPTHHYLSASLCMSVYYILIVIEIEILRIPVLPLGCRDHDQRDVQVPSHRRLPQQHPPTRIQPLATLPEPSIPIYLPQPKTTHAVLVEVLMPVEIRQPMIRHAKFLPPRLLLLNAVVNSRPKHDGEDGCLYLFDTLPSRLVLLDLGTILDPTDPMSPKCFHPCRNIVGVSNAIPILLRRENMDAAPFLSDALHRCRKGASHAADGAVCQTHCGCDSVNFQVR